MNTRQVILHLLLILALVTPLLLIPGAGYGDTLQVRRLNNPSATCIVIQPDAASGKDASISFKKPNNNYGTDDKLKVDSELFDRWRSLIQFDLSSVPPASTIVSATLSMYLDKSKGSQTESIEVHRVTASWDEATVTWNSVSGGQYDPTIVDSIVAGNKGWKQWDVQTLVQEWIDGTYSNYGMILLSPSNSGNNEKKFISSDSNKADKRPKLEICYDTLQPSVTITKSIVSPANRNIFLVGETVTFDVVIENTGATTVTYLPMRDDFDNTCLSYSSKGSSPAEDSYSNSSGQINWYDLVASNGDTGLSPGEMYTTTVSFTVGGTSNSGFNEATVSGAYDEYGHSVATTTSNTVNFTCMNPGSLEVTKVVNWNGVTPDTGQTFEICITGASYPSGNCQNADYDGGVLSWSNLIPGVYTVTETSPGVE
ncbi:MAG: DNRLRE domain-containing protein, partial [Caldilineae bacterium]